MKGKRATNIERKEDEATYRTNTGRYHRIDGYRKPNGSSGNDTAKLQCSGAVRGRGDNYDNATGKLGNDYRERGLDLEVMGRNQGPIMINWIKSILGRWQERRIRTKTLREDYRTYDRNRATLEKGGTL